MKTNKSGFSLAEVLIALAIVSIIATMAFTISKRGIERAYQQYVYTGYTGISDAISDAKTNGLEFEYDNVNESDAIEHILKIFSVDDSNVSKPGGDSIQFTAPNNIEYKIWTVGDNGEDSDSASFSPYYYIEMKVPTVKTSSGKTRETICLSYAPKEEYGVLVPFQGNGDKCTTTIESIQDRQDLLPFYIDNGKLGTRIENSTNKVEYTARKYYSFKQAACKLYGDISTISKELNCTGVSTSNVEPASGALRVANPRKIY